ADARRPGHVLVEGHHRLLRPGSLARPRVSRYTTSKAASRNSTAGGCSQGYPIPSPPTDDGLDIVMCMRVCSRMPSVGTRRPSLSGGAISPGHPRWTRVFHYRDPGALDGNDAAEDNGPVARSWRDRFRAVPGLDRPVTTRLGLGRTGGAECP